MVTAPVAIEVWRGDEVESRHRVHLCVADAAGLVHQVAGNAGERVFPRSAVKPFQALPLIESGAAERFGVTTEELALACASHNGEPMHVERVKAWLARMGLSEVDLECGVHAPYHIRHAMRPASEFGPAHNNCSGKHTGMLATALHLGEPTRGYIHADHPVQRRITTILAELCDLAELGEPGTDGCGIPTFAMPLDRLAVASARFATGEGLSEQRAAAARRLLDAMRAHPQLVAGTDRCCTAVMTAAPKVAVKTGAEGVFLAWLPDSGLGVALKAEDGITRASEPALIAALAAIGAVDAAQLTALAPFARPILRNHAGTEVGRIAPVPGWPAAT